MTTITSIMPPTNNASPEAQLQTTVATSFEDAVNNLKSQGPADDGTGSLVDLVSGMRDTVQAAVSQSNQNSAIKDAASLITDVQNVVAAKPALQAQASELFDRIRSGKDFSAYLARTGGNVDSAMKLYAKDADFLNYALGSHGKPKFANLTIRVTIAFSASDQARRYYTEATTPDRIISLGIERQQEAEKFHRQSGHA